MGEETEARKEQTNNPSQEELIGTRLPNDERGEDPHRCSRLG